MKNAYFNILTDEEKIFLHEFIDREINGQANAKIEKQK
jgi:hypothetical protein